MAVAACLARFREDYDRRTRGVAQDPHQLHRAFEAQQAALQRLRDRDEQRRLSAAAEPPKSDTWEHPPHHWWHVLAHFQGVKSTPEGELQSVPDASPSHESGLASQISFKSKEDLDLMRREMREIQRLLESQWGEDQEA
eukprot:s6229_g2.t1